jgi:hypothetical protein
MSRGPGRVERVITQAFQTHPNRAFCVEDLAPFVYPEQYPAGDWPVVDGPLVSRPWAMRKGHRITILKAGRAVADRLGWQAIHTTTRQMFRDDERDTWSTSVRVVFVNPGELASLAEGQALDTIRAAIRKRRAGAQ